MLRKVLFIMYVIKYYLSSLLLYIVLIKGTNPHAIRGDPTPKTNSGALIGVQSSMNTQKIRQKSLFSMHVSCIA